MVGGGDFMPALDVQSREGESCPPTLKLPISVPVFPPPRWAYQLSFHSVATGRMWCSRPASAHRDVERLLLARL